MLSQQELADKSGVGVATIIRIERDQVKREPHFSTLRKLAQTLKVDATELLEDLANCGSYIIPGIMQLLLLPRVPQPKLQPLGIHYIRTMRL
jgi:transcriptional regulator with XRE-family HTH domain